MARLRPLMPMLSGLWPGVPLALGAAALFGVSTPLAKVLLGAVDPLVLAGLLYLGAGLGVAALSAARTLLAGRPFAAGFERPDWPWLAGMVVAGGIAGPVLLMLGLARTDAAAASLLLNLEGLATMAIAWVVFRENVDRRLLAGAAAILAGAVLLSWTGEGPRIGPGAILIAGACLAWGIDNNLTRRLSGADPVALVMVKGLAAGSVTLTLGLGHGAGLPGALALGGALVVGALGYGLSIVMYVLALRHLGTARTGAYFATAPFVGALVAIAALGEPLTVAVVAAAVLMAAGVWLHVTERHDHEHVHEPMEHSHAHVHDAHHRHAHGPLDPPGEPHAHRHAHGRLVHAHPHFPDLHHRHDH